MKTITTVMSLIEADALCATLEANGIRSFVPDQGAVSANPLYANAIGGIRVQVADADEPLAQEILRNERPGSLRGMFTCPKCESDSVKYERVSRRLAFLSLLLIGIPLLWAKRQCTCTQCGHKWKQG
jgi:hypothetical protein